MEKKQNEERISALVTVYYPSKLVLMNIKTIAEQVDRIFICDNSPTTNYETFKNIQNAIYLFWGENRGISFAFNTVLKDLTYSWTDKDLIIFFDQDSDIPDKYIAQLTDEYKKLLKLRQSVGCLGAIYYNRSNNMIEDVNAKKYICEHIFKVSCVITSSMLCTYYTLKEIGFWNEDIFLDWADFDLCWRLIENGKYCYMTDKVVFNHSVGSDERKLGFLKIIVCTPVREYYQVRDCLKLLRKKYVPLEFKIHSYVRLIFGTIAKFVLLDNSKERFYYIKKGLIDYWSRKNGEILLKNNNEDKCNEKE